MDLYNQALAGLLNDFDEGIYFLDEDLRIQFWNRGAESLTGYPAADVIGRRCSDDILVHVDQGACQLCHRACLLARVMRSGVGESAEVYHRHRDGHRVPVAIRAIPAMDPNGKVIGVFGVFHERKAASAAAERLKELERLAMVDPLTELPNRRYLDSALATTLHDAKHGGLPAGLVLADLDRFKALNDEFGHLVGDMVLRAVSRSLKACAQSCDVVGRWGGEEFLLILPRSDARALHAAADTMRKMVAQTFLSAEGSLFAVTISMGAAMVDPDDTVAGNIERADKRLYQAKAEGRDRVVVDGLDDPCVLRG
ncbi:MAG: sensor domain-containing diguanylate cyclase [Fimbriimonadaceae bacterium]